MAAFFTAQRLTAILLIASGVVFAIGATLPLLGRHGNPGIFTLPEREYLRAIAANAVVWRWANIYMGLAGVVLLAGYGLYTVFVASARERIFAWLGLAPLLVAVAFWVAFSVFRGTVTVRAANEMTAAGGTVPGYYASAGQWGFRGFYVYAVLAFIALAIYGVALLQGTLLPGWVGWGTIVYCAALLVALLLQGDTLPAFHYLPALVMGILLLMRG